MHHEATACHVTDDILALLTMTQHILSAARKFIADKKGNKSLWKTDLLFEIRIKVYWLLFLEMYLTILI